MTGPGELREGDIVHLTARGEMAPVAHSVTFTGNTAPLVLTGVFHDFRTGILTLRAPGDARLTVLFLDERGIPLREVTAQPGEVKEVTSQGASYQIMFVTVP